MYQDPNIIDPPDAFLRHDLARMSALSRESCVTCAEFAPHPESEIGWCRECCEYVPASSPASDCDVWSKAVGR